jgi:GntR family transcriptional repressor for pyruvate dehydrogenase complex
VTIDTAPPAVGLVDRIYEQLLDKITRQDLRPGDRLPTEVQLTSEYTVSRTVVREALARLSAEGLVTSRRGAGTFVAQRPDPAEDRSSSAGEIAAVMRCYEFRIAVEGECAAIAALRATGALLDEVAACQARFEQGDDNAAAFVDIDIEFHLAVARASRNPHFGAALTAILPQIREGMALCRTRARSLEQPRHKRQDVEEHRVIVAALRAGDPDQAKAAMRSHLENARLRSLADNMDAFV